MTTKYFDSQEDLDDEFELIEESNMQREDLKASVIDKRTELKEAEQELEEFEEDNKEYLI